jgi:hypothetical protein
MRREKEDQLQTSAEIFLGCFDNNEKITLNTDHDHMFVGFIAAGILKQDEVDFVNKAIEERILLVRTNLDVLMDTRFRFVENDAANIADYLYAFWAIGRDDIVDVINVEAVQKAPDHFLLRYQKVVEMKDLHGCANLTGEISDDVNFTLLNKGITLLPEFKTMIADIYHVTEDVVAEQLLFFDQMPRKMMILDQEEDRVRKESISPETRTENDAIDKALIKELITDPITLSTGNKYVIASDAHIYELTSYKEIKRSNQNTSPLNRQVFVDLSDGGLFPSLSKVAEIFLRTNDVNSDEFLCSLKKLSLDQVTGLPMEDPVVVVYTARSYPNKTKFSIVDRTTYDEHSLFRSGVKRSVANQDKADPKINPVTYELSELKNVLTAFKERLGNIPSVTTANPTARSVKRGLGSFFKV